MRHAGVRPLLRLAVLLLLAFVALQLYFAARVALMRFVDPASTSFERSEAWRLLTERHGPAWRQQWVAAPRISASLKRAVIASEDAGFTGHGGVDWDALRRAWARNQRAEARSDRLNEAHRLQLLPQRPAAAATALPPKLIGGSTITQQLAKNLFLTGERNVVRKAQEFVITLLLEGLLGKQRILEIYLNHVEWGEGVFGAEAAARHYFHVDAAHLGPPAAARLAVMLPAPKRFEKRPDSPYIGARAATVAARMPAVDVP